MNEQLRGKIVGKLDVLSDEHGRQLLDYIDFLQSKYNRSRRAPSALQRLAENIEDALGGTTITDAAAKGTSQVADAAGRVMSGLVAAGKAVADEFSRPSPEAEEAERVRLQANGAAVEEPAGEANEPAEPEKENERPDPDA